MAHHAKDFAAAGDNRFGTILFKILAKGVIGGEKEPRLGAFSRNGFAEAVAQCVCVVGPVHEILRALRPGEYRRSGARADHRAQ